MAETPLKHLVFIPGPAWSHLRPAIKTSLRMVEKFSSLFVSLFVFDSELSKATNYLSNQSSTCLNRVKIIPASSSGEPIPEISLVNVIDTFIYLEKSFGLWIKNELQRTVDNPINGHLIGKPIGILEDQQNGGVSLACKHIHGLPVVSWWPSTAASLLSRHGNKETGHGGRVFENIIQRPGLSFADAGELYSQEVNNRLVSIPGVPIHHEWELFPQHTPFILWIWMHLIGRWTNMINNADMVVCCTTFEMAPISANALSSAFSKPIIPFFIGPAVDLETPPQQNDSDLAVTSFLDRAYAEKGAHSVIYVAFGTIYFPNSISHLTTVLNEITNSGFRFILSLSNKIDKVDESWMNTQIQAGHAIFPKWTNQLAVLDHPAIHYFLTHGGWNSSIEALVRGVPMIFWPFASDHPTNAMHIGTVHDCGFELLQVRTGPAKSTSYQNGQEIKITGTDEAVGKEAKQILELSKGPRGQHQRMNARLLGKVIADSLEKGGSGDINLERFGKALGLW